MEHKLAFIGFGVVGQGFVEIIRDKKDQFKEEYGFDPTIVAVSDLMKGSLYDPYGLNIDTLLDVVQSTGKLEGYPSNPNLIRGWDSLKTIAESNADTIVEVSYTDVKTGQPAIDHCKAAFEHKKNVIMTNKGPVALAYHELSELAKQNGVRWGFEGTVMSGTPALRMPLTTLAGNEISEVRGIFNGTTNYILTKMEESMKYEDALKEAQQLGFAEADPTSDVEGYDVLYKVVILANVVMNIPLTTDDIVCQGITKLTLEDVENAKKQGKRWKLLARITKKGKSAEAVIQPEMVPFSDPLASIMGATNAITYTCDLSGDITLVGAGAGKKETGFSLLIDLINIVRGQI
jgi:homoserine dehydrogenase